MRSDTGAIATNIRAAKVTRPPHRSEPCRRYRSWCFDAPTKPRKELRRPKLLFPGSTYSCAPVERVVVGLDEPKMGRLVLPAPPLHRRDPTQAERPEPHRTLGPN